MENTKNTFQCIVTYYYDGAMRASFFNTREEAESWITKWFDIYPSLISEMAIYQLAQIATPAPRPRPVFTPVAQSEARSSGRSTSRNRD